LNQPMVSRLVISKFQVIINSNVHQDATVLHWSMITSKTGPRRHSGAYPKQLVAGITTNTDLERFITDCKIVQNRKPVIQFINRFSILPINFILQNNLSSSFSIYQSIFDFLCLKKQFSCSKTSYPIKSYRTNFIK
jgi:hypothetical protein